MSPDFCAATRRRDTRVCVEREFDEAVNPTALTKRGPRARMTYVSALLS